MYVTENITFSTNVGKITIFEMADLHPVLNLNYQNPLKFVNNTSKSLKDYRTHFKGNVSSIYIIQGTSLPAGAGSITTGLCRLSLAPAGPFRPLPALPASDGPSSLTTSFRPLPASAGLTSP